MPERRGLLAAVSELSSLHERERAAPWAVGDAPESFIAQQLRAIVGIELDIETIQAKAKRSQNRSDEDRSAVINGLRGDDRAPGHAMADQMERDLDKQ